MAHTQPHQTHAALSALAEYVAAEPDSVAAGRAELSWFALVCRAWRDGARTVAVYTQLGYLEHGHLGGFMAPLFRLRQLEPDLECPALRTSPEVEVFTSLLSPERLAVSMDDYQAQLKHLESLELGARRPPPPGAQPWQRGEPDITDAALRRMARRGGVTHFDSRLYGEIRATLRAFLENILVGPCDIIVEHARRATVTGADVARALRLVGCAPSVGAPHPAWVPGFYERKIGGDEGDDLARPLGLQVGAMKYLAAFRELVVETLQGRMVSAPARCPNSFRLQLKKMLRRPTTRSIAPRTS